MSSFAASLPPSFKAFAAAAASAGAISAPSRPTTLRKPGLRLRASSNASRATRPQACHLCILSMACLGLRMSPMQFWFSSSRTCFLEGCCPPRSHSSSLTIMFWNLGFLLPCDSIRVSGLCCFFNHSRHCSGHASQSPAGYSAASEVSHTSCSNLYDHTLPTKGVCVCEMGIPHTSFPPLARVRSSTLPLVCGTDLRMRTGAVSPVPLPASWPAF